MTRKQVRSWTALIVVACVAGACGEAESPAAPDRAEIRASSASSGPAVQYLAKYQATPSITIGFAAKTIGPEGGTISLADFEVYVPAGAVDGPTRFTIRLPVDDPNTAEYVMAEFGPHGQQFKTDVFLRLPAKGTTSEGTDPRVLWWNGSTWEGLETRTLEDGRIEAATSHFSTYGTEDTSLSGGYIIAGG